MQEVFWLLMSLGVSNVIRNIEKEKMEFLFTMYSLGLLDVLRIKLNKTSLQELLTRLNLFLFLVYLSSGHVVLDSYISPLKS